MDRNNDTDEDNLENIHRSEREDRFAASKGSRRVIWKVSAGVCAFLIGSHMLVYGETVEKIASWDLRFISSLRVLSLGDRIDLPLATPTYAIVRSSYSAGATARQHIVVSEFSNHPYARLIVVQRGELLYARTFGLPDGEFQFCRSKQGDVVSQPVVTGTALPCEMSQLDDVDLVKQSLLAKTIVENSGNAKVDKSPVQDVIIFFNDQARVSVGGNPSDPFDDAGIRVRILASVAAANTAYADSGIDLTMRLLSVESIDYAYPVQENFNRALDELENSSDGAIDQVHDLRNLYGADFVSLWLDSNVSGGRANILSSMSDDSAFSVVRALNPVETFVHEVGHNQGCRHLPDSYMSPPSSWFSDSFAHFFTASNHSYVTVMASAGDMTRKGADARILRFSDPTLTFEGGITGVLDISDCARTLHSNRVHMAGFRPFKPGLVDITRTSSGFALGLVDAFPDRTYTLARDTDWMDSWSATGDILNTDSNGQSMTQVSTTFSNSSTMFYRFELEPQ